MTRDEFIELAIKSTPEIVALHLKESFPVTNLRVKEGTERKLEFKPLAWGFRNSPSDVLGHLFREFGRLGIDFDEIPRNYHRQIIWDACNFLDKDAEESIERIWIPGAWNYEQLKDRGKKLSNWRPYPEIAKPRIELVPYITQKGNLSIVWRPVDSGSPDNNSDWVWWPGDYTPGWSRPNDELIFIREFNHLNPGIHFSEWDDRVNYDVLDGILIGLVKSCFDHLIRLLRIPFEVTLVNDFELDLVETEKAGGSFNDRHIVGWHIFNVEQRAQRDSEEWLGKFSSTYGFTLDTVLQLYRVARFDKKVDFAGADRAVTRELKKKGFKITEGQIRSIREKLGASSKSEIQLIFK